MTATTGREVRVVAGHHTGAGLTGHHTGAGLTGHRHLRVGAGLERRLEGAAGNFVHVPPGAPHAVSNDGEAELALVVANNAQEELIADDPPG